MGSPQTLSEGERRIVAAWAADCAERVLGFFEAEAPEDPRPRDAIARARAFARGELGVAGEIRRRFIAGGAARDVKTPAAAAAARAAGQAAAIPHMGAHAMGAAAYAALAAGLAAPDRPQAASEEICWQLAHMTAAARSALRQLPPVGEDRSGPLGPGLLSSGALGRIIREIQTGLRGGDVKLEFLATVAMIAPDPSSSRKLYVETLGLPLQGEGDGYQHSEQVAGCKSFGIWPLSRAARACFGTGRWPAQRPVPQVSIEFDVEDAAAVAPAAGELEQADYALLHQAREQAWGQTVARLQSPEGAIIGISYAPVLHG